MSYLEQNSPFNAQFASPYATTLTYQDAPQTINYASSTRFDLFFDASSMKYSPDPSSLLFQRLPGAQNLPGALQTPVNGPSPIENVDNLNISVLGHTIKQGSRWVISIAYDGHVDANGVIRTTDFATGAQIPGTTPRYGFYCRNGEDVGKEGVYRLANASVGDVSPEKIILFIRKCIMQPIPPNVPSLPHCIHLPVDVVPFATHLRYFFSTFPHPFTWQIETLKEDNREQYHQMKSFLEEGIQKARQLKDKGNDAYRLGNRMGAVDAFHHAGQIVKDLLCTPNVEITDVASAKRLLAVCYANRASVWLLPGDGMDLRRCVQDAEKAEEVDPSFNKSYIRQARGYQGLGEFDKAMETLIRALSREDLMNDGDIAKSLIVLQTDGEGLPQSTEGMEEWKRRVLNGDVASSKRMRLVPCRSAWHQQVEQHIMSLS